MVEWEALLGAMAEADRELMRQELYGLMKRAQAGDLTYGRSEDVDKMVCVDVVLELRLDTDTGDRDGNRHVRLYFTEPEHVDGLMLALKLGAKMPGPMGLDEQNGHAREAERRAHAWHAAS